MITHYKKIANYLLKYFRFDLQLHFFWSFFLTIFAIFWLPLIWLGIIATIIKEGLDWWSKGHWSWDDFWFGFAGWIFGIIFFYFSCYYQIWY
jgi:hypothetical protein